MEFIFNSYQGWLMKRRAFIKLGGQVTVAGTLLTQLSACSSDDDDIKPPNSLDDLDDLGYQGAAPFVHGIASGDPLKVAQ